MLAGIAAADEASVEAKNQISGTVSANECWNWAAFGLCPYGDDCKKTHGVAKRLCAEVADARGRCKLEIAKGSCSRKFCPLTHKTEEEEEELKIPPPMPKNPAQILVVGRDRRWKEKLEDVQEKMIMCLTAGAV